MRKLCEYGEVHDFFREPIRSLDILYHTLNYFIDLWLVVTRSAGHIVTLRDVL